jgi:hypothetical protein
MSQSNSDKSISQSSIDSAITPISHEGMQPIEAELVENDYFSTPRGEGQLSGDRVGDLVPLSHHAILDVEYLATAERTTPQLHKTESHWQDLFMTPWTIAAMLMVITANILLGFSQWNRPNQLTAEQNSSTLTPATQQPPAKSIPKNIDLAAEKSSRLDVAALSLIETASQTPIAVSPPSIPAPQTTSVPQPPAIAAKSTPSLSQALLPPSLQPQPTVQNYTPPASLPVVAQPPLPSPPSVPSTLGQTPSVAPSPAPTQNPMQTVPTLPENSDPITEFSQRHVAEQRRLEEENLPTPTLYQQTRIEGLSRQYQLDPNSLTRQVQQMQKEQVPSSVNGETVDNAQPIVPPPTTNNASPPDNGQPSVEIKNDGSVEIRSNSLR